MKKQQILMIAKTILEPRSRIKTYYQYAPEKQELIRETTYKQLNGFWSHVMSCDDRAKFNYDIEILIDTAKEM